MFDPWPAAAAAEEDEEEDEDSDAEDVAVMVDARKWGGLMVFGGIVKPLRVVLSVGW